MKRCKHNWMSSWSKILLAYVWTCNKYGKVELLYKKRKEVIFK